MSNIQFPHINEEYFRQAVESTYAATLFSPVLIEKDYFCSLILRELYSTNNDEIVFKGGTLLNKVHAGFYRLSEDLDFTISMPSNASRKERSNKVKHYKQLLMDIADKIPYVSLGQPLTGSNNSTQYNAVFEYESLRSTKKGTILFEIGLRERILQAPVRMQAGTILLDSYSMNNVLPDVPVLGYTKLEAYAEKFRAALSRLRPAIRDIYDIQYAISNNIVKFDCPSLQKLLFKKLLSPVRREMDLSLEKKLVLKKQLTAQLAPVLRPIEYESFDFESAWESMTKMGESIQAEQEIFAENYI